MTSLSQSPRDRILWILDNNDGKMERSRLRASTGMRYALLSPILDELAEEGKIKMTVGKHGDLITKMMMYRVALLSYVTQLKNRTNQVT